MHNNTVVTDPVKGGRLNRLTPIYGKYGVPELYNFEPRDMSWVTYQPRAKMLVLDRLYPEGIRLPDYFMGKNIVHLPTVKCHIYTTTTGAMKTPLAGCWAPSGTTPTATSTRPWWTCWPSSARSTPASSR